MKTVMTKRERVEATLNLKETDRVPVYDILLNDAAIEHFGGQYAPMGEEGIKIKCKATAQMLDMTRMLDGGPAVPGETIDEDGFVHVNERWTSAGTRTRPFCNEEGAMEWLKKANQRLLDENKKFDPQKAMNHHHERCKILRGYLGDDTVVLQRESGTGLDTIRYDLGFELFSYIQADKPELISEYLDLSTEKEVKLIHAIADPKLSPCVLTYGDIAGKGRLLHSPTWLRNEFMPRLKKLNDAWHAHDIKCLFHSDGYYMDVIPDLIDAGIDGLNPIESVAGMSLLEVKQKYGDQLFIAGSIDISQLMSNGTPDEVKKECQEAIRIGYPGYFIGSTTELDNGSRLENILEMLDIAWKTTLL